MSNKNFCKLTNNDLRKKQAMFLPLYSVVPEMAHFFGTIWFSAYHDPLQDGSPCDDELQPCKEYR